MRRGPGVPGDPAPVVPGDPAPVVPGDPAPAVTARRSALSVLALGAAAALALGLAAPEGAPALRVPSTADFAVTGDGANPAWEKAPWTALRKRTADGHPYEARFKALHSPTGIYFLFDGTDAALTSSLPEDFLDLWKEDVFEVFLWPDERHPLYFEYEISPLGRELPILVPNVDGQFLGWRPWHYEGERRTRKATAALGGARESGAKVAGWRAEVFIPYTLLKPLGNVPPKPGARWRANVYRMDHDGGRTTGWDWARVGPSFHEFEKFGTLVFE